MVCPQCLDALSTFNYARCELANWPTIVANQTGRPVFEVTKLRRDRLVEFWQCRGWTSSVLTRCPCNAFGREQYAREVEVWAAYYHPEIRVRLVRERIAGPLFSGPADAEFWATRNRSSLLQAGNADDDT